MKNAYDPNELSTLVEALLDQSITNEQSLQLGEILAKSPDARRDYFDLLDVHLGLRRLQSSKAFVELAMAQADEAVPVGFLQRNSPLALIICSAATFLIGIAVASWWPSKESPDERFLRDAVVSQETNAPTQRVHSESTVILAQSDGAQFFGELPPLMGEKLAQDRQYILTSGSVQLTFPTGASTIIDSPSIFRIASSNRLMLETGNCSVHKPEGAEDFEVETPVTHLADLGSRFGVSVQESGETDVQVVEGAVETPSKSVVPAIKQSTVSVDAQQSKNQLPMPNSTNSTNESSPYYRFQLPDRLLTYDAVDSGEGCTDLTAIQVQRGDEIHHYSISEMIPSEVFYFNSNQVTRIQPLSVRYGDPRPVAELIHSDDSLETGLLNPGGAKNPLKQDPVLISDLSNTDTLTPGMGIRFKYAVTNSPGPDIAFFEIQSFSNPPEGDFFHISPVKFRQGLKAHTVRSYDISMTSPEAKVVNGFGLLSYTEPVNSLAAVINGDWKPTYKHENFRAIAVGIDLSELGYKLGEQVDELFIQDAADDNAPDGGSRVDPVYIGGFPELTAKPQTQPSAYKVQ